MGRLCREAVRRLLIPVLLSVYLKYYSSRCSADAKTSASAGPAAAAGTDTVEGLQSIAAQQRMNTPLRREIFLAIMDSEVRFRLCSTVVHEDSSLIFLLASQDFIHAFERLMKLNLKGKQTREIINVLLDCCGQVCLASIDKERSLSR